VLRTLARVPGLRLVGGWLRGACLGRRSYDLDLTCEQPLDEAVAAVAEVLRCKPFALNERYPTRRLVHGKYTIDISQLTGGSVAADIARRDYTCNTLMVRLDKLGPELTTADIEGHAHALDDIGSRALRMVSAGTLADDPLRILRGYRFCATEGYSPEPDTRAAWKQLAGTLRQSASERIHDELLRWFAAPSVHDTLAMCADDGVLWEVFPALRAMPDCIQGEEVDVWSHTLDCLRQLDVLRLNMPPELAPYAEHFAAAWNEKVGSAATAGALTRLAMLLHDCGKPATRAVTEDGRPTFYDHQTVGAELAKPELKALVFSNDERDYILAMVVEHLRLGFYTDDPPPMPPRLIYRYIRKLGRATPLMLLHSIADCMASHGDWTARALEEHIAGARQVIEHYYALDNVAQPKLWLDGDEIMRVFKLRPSKLIGELKDMLLEATAAGEVVGQEEAVGYLRREIKRRRAAGEQIQ
jgi:putative nucleotidyltransferase with HDIG domain